jgi:CheY-like chemotaxis protein
MRKILVIDDDEFVRRYFVSLLSRLGYEVEMAVDGKEGLEKVVKPGVDLVISDLFMPGTPFGIDLIRQIREIKPDCPIVVISGESDTKTVEDCATLGVTDFLTKPFEMGFIKTILERLLK